MLVGTSQIKTFNVYVIFGIKQSATLLVHLWKEKKKTKRIYVAVWLCKKKILLPQQWLRECPKPTRELSRQRNPESLQKFQERASCRITLELGKGFTIEPAMHPITPVGNRSTCRRRTYRSSCKTAGSPQRDLGFPPNVQLSLGELATALILLPIVDLADSVTHVHTQSTRGFRECHTAIHFHDR